MIYSVCSFELNECEHHLTRLLDKFGDKIEVVSPATRLPNYYKKYVTRKNYLAVYAGNPDDMDGFSAFIIRIKKSKIQIFLLCFMLFGTNSLFASDIIIKSTNNFEELEKKFFKSISNHRRESG